jgi:hypothetical protein
MKYKFLTQDELELLENELLQFLIVHGVDGPTWKKMNEEHPEKAVELVGVFSDLVWQRSLEKVKFIEQLNADAFGVFAFHSDYCEFYNLRSKSNDSSCSSFDDFIVLLKENPSQMEITRLTKNYSRPREMEIFEMLNNGLLLSHQSKYDILQNIHKNA